MRTAVQRDKKTAYQRKKRHQISELKKQIKSERGCKICGETRWYMLVFHHKNIEDKEFELSDMIPGQPAKNGRKKMIIGDGSRGGNYFTKEKLLLEIAKCDVYCMNHHAELHYQLIQK